MNNFAPKKLAKPMNPLIWNTAASMCAEWFEIALSSGLPPGKYVGRGDKPIRMFVRDKIEIFVPMAISILLDMLKPTSNCTDHMRNEIYHALIDPTNDLDLMEAGKSKTKNEHEKMILDAIQKFDKNQMKFNAIAPLNVKKDKVDLKASTALGK